ncbi:MAG: TOBE domain-containing protein [Ilumatobacter sp.]|uniref:TOBE domain-containing protein n=1 Tax=Ilumatobacter sp. TaxID=1967498 RepID=UPI00329A5483
MAIRPATVRVTGSPTGEWTVRRRRYLGPTTEILVQHTHGGGDDADDPFDVIASLPTASAPPVGATVDVEFTDTSTVVLPD